MGGNFIWTLTSVEISSGWTELRAVWNRGQQACFEALESIWESQPFHFTVAFWSALKNAPTSRSHSSAMSW
jgi:hypothetical protein